MNQTSRPGGLVGGGAFPAGEETIDYAFMGDNPDAADNRWLREAVENRIPIIYSSASPPAATTPSTPPSSTAGTRTLKARVSFAPAGTATSAHPIPPCNAATPSARSSSACTRPRSAKPS